MKSAQRIDAGESGSSSSQGVYGLGRKQRDMGLPRHWLLRSGLYATSLMSALSNRWPSEGRRDWEGGTRGRDF